MTDVFSLIALEEMGESIHLPDGTYLNTVTSTGLYDFADAADITGDMVGSYYLQVHAYDSNNVSQMAISFNTNKTFFRKKFAGTWIDWEKLQIIPDYITTANLDNIIETGSYMLFDPVTNKPAQATGTNFYVQVVGWDDGIYTMQVLYDMQSNRAWSRRNYMGWTAWTQLSNETIIMSDAYAINSLVTSGNYYVFNGVNAPTASIGYYYHVIAHSSSYITQMAYRVDNNSVYTRRFVSSAWTAWSQISNDAVILSGSDLNTLISSGSYFISTPSATNAPDGTGSIYLTVISHSDTNFILQNAYSRGTNRLFTRRREQGTWTGWSELASLTGGALVGDLASSDTRAVATLPSEVGPTLSLDLKAGSTLGLPQNFYSTQTFRSWSDDSGGPASQLAYGIDGPWYRSGTTTGGWKPWIRTDAGRVMDFTTPVTFPSGISENHWNNAVVYGRYAYMSSNINGPTNGTFWRYDLLTNAFAQMTSPPTGSYIIYGLCVDAAAGYIYASANRQISSDQAYILRYNISANTWTTFSGSLTYSGTSQSMTKPILVNGYVCVVMAHSGTQTLSFVRFTKPNFTSSATTGWGSSGSNTLVPNQAWGDGVNLFVGLASNQTVWFDTSNMGWSWGQIMTGNFSTADVTANGGRYFYARGGFSSEIGKLLVWGTYKGIGQRNLNQAYDLPAVKTVESNGITSPNGILFFPDYGRVLCSSGTYQNIPELHNF